MKKVEIFRTNVCREAEANAIIHLLSENFPHYCISFDLEDCDNILRVETPDNDINEHQIEQLLTRLGHTCIHLI